MDKTAPKGPRHTPVLTPGSVHFMSKLNSSFWSLKGFHFSQCPSFSFFSSAHHTLYPSSFPGRNNRTRFRVARARVKLSQRPVYTLSHPFPGTRHGRGRNQACQAKVIVSTVHLPHLSVICNSTQLAEVLTHHSDPNPHPNTQTSIQTALRTGRSNKAVAR